MKRSRILGTLLVGLSLLAIIAMIVSNHILWFFVDLLMILVCGIVGVILIMERN